MAGNRKPRIIVVDDDDVLRSVLKEGLTAFEYESQTASSGAAALKHMMEVEFDVMIADIVMPGMDGFELTRKAKQLKPDLSVIVMTGFQQEESYGKAVTAGASDFIKKPFTIGELIVRIDRVMRDKQVLAGIRQRQEEVRKISRDMISGVQDEASQRIARLEEEIVNLRKQMI